MGIVFMASADIQDMSVWSVYSGASVSNTTARTGSYSYRVQYNNNMQINVAARADYYLKMGFYGTSADNALRNRFYIRESGTSHLCVLFNLTNGQIDVRRGGEYDTLLGSTSGITLNASTWYCVEIYANIHDSTGTVTIKINGTTCLSLTSQDTRNGGTGVIDNFQWVCGNDPMYIDDIVIRDDAWPGTGGLYLLTPDGDGSDTGWTASTGSRYTCINEVPPNDFINYISTDAGTANVKNTCTFSNLAITPQSIAAVAVLAKAKLSAAGAGNIRAIVKSGSTYGNGASTALSTSALWTSHFATVDPDTSAAWDATGVNALSAGVETL